MNSTRDLAVLPIVVALGRAVELEGSRTLRLLRSPVVRIAVGRRQSFRASQNWRHSKLLWRVSSTADSAIEKIWGQADEANMSDSLSTW